MSDGEQPAFLDRPAAEDGARRALVVTAHPDDAEFGCAGSVAAWVDAGWEVAYVVATAGERGSQDPHQDLVAYAEDRRREARAAAAEVGVTDVTFLGFEDGTLAHGEVLLKAIAREFRRSKPHRVVAMVPDLLPAPGFINHTDHRTIGIATLDVCLAAGTTNGWYPELATDEGLPAWRGLEQVWQFGPGLTEHVEDVTATIDRKIAALRHHVSQIGERDIGPWVKQRLRPLGARAGGEYGEGFRIIDLRR